jgi:hypothetical protein
MYSVYEGLPFVLVGLLLVAIGLTTKSVHEIALLLRREQQDK